MPDAIERWLQEQPDPDSGLGRLQQLALDAIHSGIHSTAEIFQAVAANDSHQNQKVRLEANPDGSVVAFDGTEQAIWKKEGIPARLLMVAFGLLQLPREKTVLANVQVNIRLSARNTNNGEVF